MSTDNCAEMHLFFGQWINLLLQKNFAGLKQTNVRALEINIAADIFQHARATAWNA